MILLNGKPADCLPIADRGLQYGDGVWETVLIKQGKAIFLEEHLQRLQWGLRQLKISLDIKQLSNDINQILEQANENILKIIITRGAGGRGYNPAGLQQSSRILSLHPVPKFPESYQSDGIKLTLCETRLSHNPYLAGFKHLNRLEQVLARAEFAEPFQEGLVRDYQGNIIEGTMSNLFIINDNQLTTPLLNNCGIAGIMRGYIIKQLQRLSYGIEYKDNISLADVKRADAMFMTNSVIGIWAVRQLKLKSETIDYLPQHPIIKELRNYSV